jgi:hypothetical protein
MGEVGHSYAVAPHQVSNLPSIHSFNVLALSTVWVCGSCTLINAATVKLCSVCGAPQSMLDNMEVAAKEHRLRTKWAVITTSECTCGSLSGVAGAPPPSPWPQPLRSVCVESPCLCRESHSNALNAFCIAR